jgi:hypothetical protein
MSSIKEYISDLSFDLQANHFDINLESTIKELPLYKSQFEISCPGQNVAQAFQDNPLLPGIILTDRGKFAGMISRRRFLEQMSLPYGHELFLRRSIASLYRFVTNLQVLTFKSDTTIVDAARLALKRPEKLVYEPVLVEMAPENYCLLDMQNLLLADSQIHQLTCHLLNKEMTQATKALKQQLEKMSKLEPQEKITHLGQMMASIASELKNPTQWNKNLEFLFLYCKQIREALLMYETSMKQKATGLTNSQEELDLDVIWTDLPKNLETMKADTERLTKFIKGLQILSDKIIP